MWCLIAFEARYFFGKNNFFACFDRIFIYFDVDNESVSILCSKKCSIVHIFVITLKGPYRCLSNALELYMINVNSGKVTNQLDHALCATVVTKCECYADTFIRLLTMIMHSPSNGKLFRNFALTNRYIHVNSSQNYSSTWMRFMFTLKKEEGKIEAKHTHKPNTAKQNKSLLAAKRHFAPAKKATNCR